MGNQVLLGINVCFLFCLVISFLSGLKKGAYKSIYQIITRYVIYIALWFLFDGLVAFIMGYDLTSYNINTTLNSASIQVTSANNFLQELIRGYYQLDQSVDVTQLEIYGFIYGTIAMVMKLLLILIVWLLNITVIKFIFFIIWLIIKPNYRKNKKAGKTISPLSRLTGALVSSLSCLVFYFILSIFLSGLFSITDSVLTVTDGIVGESQTQPVSYAFRVKEVDSNDQSYSNIRNLPQLSNPYIQETLDVITNYRSNVYFIKVFDLVKVNETPIDLYAFDELLQIKYDVKVDDKTTTRSVKIRKELESIKNIISIIVEEKEASGCSNILETMSILSDEKLTLITDNLKQLKFLEVGINLGCEYVTVSPVIKEGLEKLGSVEVNLEQTVNIIKDSDILPQIGSALKGVSGTLDLVNEYAKEHANEDGSVNLDIITLLTTSDETKVQNVLDNISEITLLDDLTSILIAIAANSQSFKDFTLIKPTITYNDTFVIDGNVTDITGDINSYELVDIDGMWHINGFNTNVEVKHLEINFEDIKLTSDIKQLGPLFRTLKELNITSINYFKDTNMLMELLKNEEVFTNEKIDSLCNDLFNLTLVSTILGQSTTILDTFIPQEFKEYIKISNHTIKANDLSSLLKLAQIASVSGLLGSENPDMAKFFNDYKDQVLDLVYGSDILKSNINGIIKMAINGTGDLIDGEVLTNYDFSKEENKAELQKLFDIAGGLLDSETGVFVDGVLNQNKLLEYIVENKENIVSSNLICDVFASTIIKQSKEGSLKDVISCTLEVGEEWRGQNGELSKLLTCLELMFTTDGVLEIDINNLNIDSMVAKISDEAIQDAICASRVISDTAIMYIKKMEKTPENPDGIIVIDLDDESKWYDGSHGDGELRKLLVAFGKLEITNFEAIDANSIISKLNDDIIDSICDSVILSDTICSILEENSTTNGGMICLDGVDLKENNYDELRKALKCFTKIHIESIETINVDKLTEELDNDEFIDAVCVSTVMTNTLVYNLYNSGIDMLYSPSEGEVTWTDTYVGEVRTDGELRKVLKGVRLLLKKPDNRNYSFSELTTDIVINKLKDDAFIDSATNSIVLSKTVGEKVSEYAYNEATNPTGQIIVRENIVWEGSDGELKKFVNAINVLFTDNINLNNFNVDMILTLTETDVNTLILSDVLEDTIRHQLLKQNPDGNGNIQVKSEFINTKEALSAELNKLISACNIILDDGTGNVSISNEFNFDNVLKKTDSEIDIVFASLIIKETIDKAIYDLIESDTGSLKDTLVLRGSNEEEKMQFVRNDSRTLVKTFMDLNNEGISYKELNFTTFSSKLDTEEESDKLAWTLVQSNIITASLPTLMEKIVNGTSLSEDKKAAINYNLSDDVWRGDKNTTNPGEAAKLFRVLNLINTFDGSQSYSDKNTITEPLDKINESKVVRGLLVSYIEELTESINDWRYPTETWKDLTIEEMDKEIDNIGDVVTQKDVISISSTQGLSDAKIKELRTLMRVIVPSRIFNLNGIKSPMVKGLNSLIGTSVEESNLGEITRTSTYDPSLTEDENETKYQYAWFEEIDNLMHAVHKMNLETNSSYLGMEKIAFVDACNKSVIMEGAISIVTSHLHVTTNDSCPPDLSDYEYTYSSLKVALSNPSLPPATIEAQIRSVCEAMILDETVFRNTICM